MDAGLPTRFRIRPMMRRKLLVAVLSALLLISPAPTRAWQKRPLTRSDLLRLLDGRVYSGRVTMLVRERGITFWPTQRYLEMLRRAGADKQLLGAVVTARRITLQTAEGSSNNCRPGHMYSEHALVGDPDSCIMQSVALPRPSTTSVGVVR
jgi:hypothetical protein